MGSQASPMTADGEVAVLGWVKQHRRATTVAASVLALVAAGAWFAWTARSRRESFAARALQGARSSAEAGNLPLAASDLSRLVSSYGGTVSGDEASLLLAQVRLLQNQAPLAVADLKKFVASAPHDQFRGPGQQLLGSALEQLGQAADAGRAYEAAAAGFTYRPIRAQSLNDAGRAYWLAADTARAATAYERVVREFSDQPSALEAKIRLSELRRSPPSPAKR